MRAPIRFSHLRPNGDAILIASGVTLAVSASLFAAVMVTQNTGAPRINAVEHLAIFSMPVTSPYLGGAPVKPRPPAVYDMTPVGALPPSATAQQIAQSYRLRAYVQGDILLLGPDGLVSTKAGGDLPGLGRVLRVEARDRRLVVVTEGGLILD